jgi:hypothetical protein
MNQIPDYDVIPANNNCSNIQNKPIIKLTSGTATANASDKINDFHTQHLENTKYDSIDSVEIKPLKGGNKEKINNYKIRFLNKDYIISGNNEIEIIKKFINNRKFKKENILEISNNKNISLYVIKSNIQNKFKKLYK